MALQNPLVVHYLKRKPLHPIFLQHDGRGVFAGVSQPFVAGRYHSLVVSDPPPEVLEITARTDEGVIMGLRHREWPVHGVQFHPESVLTESGKKLLENFLAL